MVREAFFWYLVMKNIIIKLSLMKEPPPSDSLNPEGMNMEKESEVFRLFGTITVFLGVRVSKTRWYCHSIGSFALSLP